MARILWWIIALVALGLFLAPFTYAVVTHEMQVRAFGDQMGAAVERAIPGAVEQVTDTAIGPGGMRGGCVFGATATFDVSRSNMSIEDIELALSLVSFKPARVKSGPAEASAKMTGPKLTVQLVDKGVPAGMDVRCW